jgi:hypothetical protein
MTSSFLWAASAPVLSSLALIAMGWFLYRDAVKTKNVRAKYKASVRREAEKILNAAEAVRRSEEKPEAPAAETASQNQGAALPGILKYVDPASYDRDELMVRHGMRYSDRSDTTDVGGRVTVPMAVASRFYTALHKRSDLMTAICELATERSFRVVINSDEAGEYFGTTRKPPATTSRAKS